MIRNGQQDRNAARLTSVTRAVAVLCALTATAQAPRTGTIDFYGLRRITREKILGAINLKPGDPLPPSKGDLEDKIAEVPGIVEARVEAVCCEGPDAILFIGIEEKGAPHFAPRSQPAGDVSLPQGLVDAYHDFLRAVQRAASEGHAAEDLTAGHSMMADPEARAFQEQFAAFASTHVSLLRSVLRTGSEEEQRAIAAAVIGYAPKKQEIESDLEYAVDDPDAAVRANAMRSLAAIGVLAATEPVLNLHVSPTWFVEALNSVVLSDRVEAVKALLILTDRDNRAALDLLRERALPALVEMARWEALRYALPPFLLLGRIAGLPDDRTHDLWEKRERETVIRAALRTARKGRKAER